MEAGVPPVAPACGTTDPLREEFPRPVALGSTLPEAKQESDGDGGDDEEDKTDGEADFFAEFLAGGRGGGGGCRVRRVGGGGGEEREGGAGEGSCFLALLVHGEVEGEIGCREASEPIG